MSRNAVTRANTQGRVPQVAVLRDLWPVMVAERRPAATCGAAAFTLIEVMVSLLIALLLIVGINEVFSTTSQTVGAGQAMSDVMRDQRAAQSVFYNDWRGAALADSPCIIIDSFTTSAFMSKADADGNGGDTNPLHIVINGVTTDLTTTPYVYNYRNHRTDTLSFFARGNFPRMTGNTNGSMVSNMSSNEAWINYGHLWLPDNADAYSATTYPGAGTAVTNPNNFYADQWVLGRSAMLLRTPISNTINDNSTPVIPQNYYNGAGTLAPLAYNSQAGGGGGDNSYIYQSHYDLAGTSIESFRSAVVAVAPVPSVYTDTWWQPLAYVYPLTAPLQPYRFQCDPFSALNRGALTNAAMAQTYPYFLKGCTQFMVEFAGDFLTQSTTGAVTANTPDGTTDFYIDSSGVRQVRWYGLPRDTDNTAGVTFGSTSGDVQPVGSVNGGTRMPYEKVVSGSPLQYLCVFGPSDPHPTMLRITITLTDPNNRLANPQSYEYVLGTP